MKVGRFLTLAAIALASFALPVTAGATVKREGSWPAVEKKVDLEADGPPSEALKQLAHEAGWSLVLQDGAAIDRAGADVHVAVEGQPADAVLEALFVGRDVIAHRNGPLVTISAPGGSTNEPPATATAVPTPSPFPTARGEDRELVGANLVVQPNEIVHDATVTGGNATIRGTVTGDLVVTGGSATLGPKAHLVGDATVVGGTLRIEKGAVIDGELHVTGGDVVRDDEPSDDEEGGSRIASAARGIGRALTRASLLFVLGCVLMALLAPRMERLRLEIASRPMRSFALGVLGALLGSIGLTVLLVILCITVIGIPVALALVLSLVLALYGSVTSVLTTFGAGVAGHRTTNPYVHLLIGCAAFLVITAIPYLGWLASFVVMMLALGALLATRGAGLFDRKPRGLMV
jgi:hypothetical protein